MNTEDRVALTLGRLVIANEKMAAQLEAAKTENDALKKRLEANSQGGVAAG